MLELDALEPSVISNLIETEVRALEDPDIRAEVEDKEFEDKQSLIKICKHYSEIAEYADSLE